MNVRISQNELRFRVSQEELATLCEGTVLEQLTPRPGATPFVMVISPGSATDSPLHLEWSDQQLLLTVDATAAQELLESLPRRDGLEVKQLLENEQSLDIQLEVDIRTQKRK